MIIESKTPIFFVFYLCIIIEHMQNTRNKNNLNAMQGKKSYVYNSVLNIYTRIYNKMPRQIKECTNLTLKKI